MEKVRINKFLSQAAGLARRKADAAIAEGRVSINGKVIFEGGLLIDPESETVRLDGSMITLIEEKVYIMLHKPTGVLTTMQDPRGRKTIADIVDYAYPRVFPVGRLDYNTSGLILLTNDGDLANRLAHPRFRIEKTYVAKVKGIPTKEKLNLLRKGIQIDGKLTVPGRFEISETRKDKSWVTVKISEGRYRQIRKMFAKIGHPVLKLKRTGFATLTLENLPPGEWRYLEKREMAGLRRYADDREDKMESHVDFDNPSLKI